MGSSSAPICKVQKTLNLEGCTEPTESGSVSAIRVTEIGDVTECHSFRPSTVPAPKGGLQTAHQQSCRTWPGMHLVIPCGR